MAYREVAMWEILNVLLRIGRGESQASVGRVTGYDRKTVRNYVRAARRLGWKPGEEEATEELASRVVQALRPARERGQGESEALLLPHTEQIREWLKAQTGEKRGLRLTKVHQLLARKGVHVPYSSLHRFAIKHCGLSERQLTVRVAETEPGEAAELDFGRLGLIHDPESGRRRTVWGMLVTLSFSRHQYLHLSYTQTAQDVITGLEDAWAFFGGVVRRLVIDNLTPAVKKADRYDPIFQRTFEEYARYRGFIIDATVPAHPTGKPRVERGVPYARESFFRGEDWRDLEHAQRQAVLWCLHTAGTRVHGTTRKRPLAVFENEERAKLLPLTGERYDPPRWVECTVHPDHHINVDKAAYSLPTRFVGKKVSVRSDRKLVRIFYEGEQIKLHARQPEGGRSTDYDDYPKEKSSYALRDPQRLIRQARSHGEQLGRFMEALLAGDFPWAKLRQGQKLLRLGEKYGWPRLERACQRALAFDLINVRRVETIVRQDFEQLDAFADGSAAGETPIVADSARFQRPAGSFSHANSNSRGDA